MANLTENTRTPEWSEGIYQIETSDPVLGGANGIANRQAKELGARTQWLKSELAKAVALIGTNQQTSTQQFALKTTSLTAGAGLQGGGVLRDNMTLSLGTPSKITATTTNSAVSNTHTHEIDKASTTTAGIVKLNNTLTSTAQNEALTAAQGKALAEQISAAVSGSLNLKGVITTQNLNDLNDVANYGVWQNASNANATTEHNYPTQKAGTLLVLPSAYKGQQVYIPYDEKVFYMRDTRSNATPPTWGDWSKIGEVINALDNTATTAALSAAMGKKLNDEKLGNSGNQTLLGSLNVQREINAGGLVSTSYRNDWVGFRINQPTEGKNCMLDMAVNNVLRGGLQITSASNGEYRINLKVTPSGTTTSDRQVNGMVISATEITTNAYGALHTGFVRSGVGIGQSTGHQVKIGWSSEQRLKATVDTTDLGSIVFDSHFPNQKSASGYQKLPNGLILQWGEANAGKVGTTARVNFPIAFPSFVCNVQAIHIGTDQNVNIVVTNINSTGFDAKSTYNSNNVSIYWFAIGY